MLVERMEEERKKRDTHTATKESCAHDNHLCKRRKNKANFSSRLSPFTSFNNCALLAILIEYRVCIHGFCFVCLCVCMCAVVVVTVVLSLCPSFFFFSSTAQFYRDSISNEIFFVQRKANDGEAEAEAAGPYQFKCTQEYPV